MRVYLGLAGLNGRVGRRRAELDIPRVGRALTSPSQERDLDSQSTARRALGEGAGKIRQLR